MSNVIDNHFANWNQAINLSGDRAVIAGFVTFAYDMAQETRTLLADGDLEQLASDVVYSAKQAGDVVSEAEAVEWLTSRRAELIEALDEAIAGK